MFLANEDPINEVLPHELFRIGSVHVTNIWIMALVAAVLMLWIFPSLFPRPDGGVPTGAKNLFESILEFLRIEVFRPALKEHTDRFVPFLWTVFFFILFCNLLGVIPIASFFELITGGHVKHFGGAATSNINTTAALAVCAFFFIHANGIDMIAHDLIKGTYGKHGHHEEHSANGLPPHEASVDLDHMRGEALAADVPGNFAAIGDPVAHYRDDEFRGAAPMAANMERKPRARGCLRSRRSCWRFRFICGISHPIRFDRPKVSRKANGSWISRSSACC